MKHIARVFSDFRTHGAGWEGVRVRSLQCEAGAGKISRIPASVGQGQSHRHRCLWLA